MDMSDLSRRGRKQAAEAGRAVTVPSYGYKARGRGKREVDPEQADVVRRIGRLYIDGKRLEDIAAILNQEGVPSPRASTVIRGSTPSGRWSTSAVNRLVKNPVYAGFVRYRGELFPGEHEPIWTPEEWAAISSRNDHARVHPFHHARRGYILSNLAYCGLCGSKLRGTSRKGGPGLTLVNSYYMCPKRSKLVPGGPCELPMCRCDAYEAEVFSRVQRLLSETGSLQKTIQEQIAKDKVDVSPLQAEAKNIRRQLQTKTQEIERLMGVAEHGAALVPDVAKRIRGLHAERERLGAKLAKLPENINWEEKAEAYFQLASHFSALWEQAGNDERRAMLQALIRKITFYPDPKDIEIDWNIRGV